ncbi:hypothetical protein ACFLSX_04635, partial [Calditrichota bacterium]
EDEELNYFQGGLGVTWIDGVSYTTFSLTPDFSFGKFGVGLNIELLFNNTEGFQFRKEGWDKGAGILRAIRYLRYGYKREPFYVRVGTLDNATLGHGFIMWHYSNESNYDERKIGLEFDLDFNRFGFETVTSNLGNLEIIGSRLYYRPLLQLSIPVIKDLELGATYVTDESTADENNIGDGVSSWGLDIGLPIINSKLFYTNLYYDFAKINHFGSGNAAGVEFGFPNIIGVFKLSAKLEKRFLGEQFLPSYFDALYELDRELNKKATLQAVGSNEGIFGQLAGSIFGKLKIIGSYQRLNGVDYSGIMHFETRLQGLIPSIRLRATYDKVGIESFDDITTLNHHSIATAEIGYRTMQFLMVSMIYRWNFVYDEEKKEYKPQERVEPRISFVYEF